MSDLEIVSALDAMERLLQGESLEPEAVAAWQRDLEAALATAERGTGWSGIVARAREVSRKLDDAAHILAAERDELRKRMDLQVQGTRALKGYKPF